MGYEQKNNQGALFTIDVEKRKQNGPMATGSVTIGGTRYRLAAWKREGKNGRPAWISLAVSDWEERRGGREPGEDANGF